MIIETKKLSKQFVSSDVTVNAVNNIDCVLKEQSIVIVGPSGSGKTTFLDLIGLLTKQTSGEIFFDGVEIANKSSREQRNFIKQNVSYIFQSYNLIENLTMTENIRLACHGDVDEKLFESITTRLGIQSVLKKYPNEVSGGQKQRVAIARALIKKPKLLLGDELTGALDQKTTYEVLDLLFELQREYSFKMIVVTHDLGITSKFDRVIKYKDGRIENDQLQNN